MVNWKMEWKMVGEFKRNRMVLIIMAVGKMIYKVDMVMNIGQMAQNMKEIISMDINMVKLFN